MNSRIRGFGICLPSIGLTASALAQTCPTCVPLTDLGSGFYQGVYQGGLYAGGSNSPPVDHLSAALAQAALIQPRNTVGAEDPEGLIGFIALGMSNTSQEFAPFERGEDLNLGRRSRVILVNTAQGGVGAEQMADPNSSYWNSALQRVASAGLDPDQVQVAWLKQALGSVPTTAFPAHADALKGHAVSILQRARELFPNLRLVYVSSRIYGGYTTNPGRAEPLSYESAFAYKWLIEDQIAGDPELNYGQVSGLPVKAPLVLWGPYLWANGSTPRSDGISWVSSDYETDFIHPAPDGEGKVAQLLASFFASDASASMWYAGGPGPTLVALDATDDATVRSDAPTTPGGAASDLQIGSTGGSTRRVFLRFDASAYAGRTVLHAALSLRNIGPGTFNIRGSSSSSWSEATLTWQTQPSAGPIVRAVPGFSNDASSEAEITALVASDADSVISLALESDGSGAVRRYVSTEGGQAPRLVLLLAPPACTGDADGDGDVDFGDITAALAQWGGAGPIGDADGNGIVNFADLTAVLSRWGSACP